MRYSSVRHQAVRLIFFALAVCFVSATGLAYAQGRADETTEIKQILHQANQIASDISKETEDAEEPYEKERERCDLHTHIAIARAKAGDLLGAIATAVGIRDDACKQDAFLAVNKLLGDPQNALRVADDIRDEGAKTFLMRAVVLSQMKAGDIEGARHTASGIRDGSVKTGLLMHIARTQAGKGNVQGALDTVAGLPPKMAPGFFCSMGSALAAAGDFSGAAKTADYFFRIAANVPSSPEKPKFLLAGAEPIWIAQARAGDRSGAARTLELTFRAILDVRSETTEKAYALGIIARAQAKLVGDYVGASKSVEQALETAGYIPESVKGKDRFLSGIAITQAAVGDVRGAMQTAAGIREGSDKDEALIAIVRAQAKSGIMPGAYALAASSSSALVRAQALVAIAEGLLERVDVEKAQTAANPNRP